ncbi:acyl-CoA thioesterase 5 [Plakobranchus ocellatus]|uniref:Acyl-CoA thioesterase 5 n=1 Tax=Plakobranchus ocellatus TaxID=259542 RepID=A0AAV4BQI7_9GAST|nr:acyl-CoA thioesterase 5 [Plakobranchus ocellatus]
MGFSGFYRNTLYQYEKSIYRNCLGRKSRLACNLHQYAPKIHVTPTHTLIDEEVQIVTSGLHPGQKVTLFAHLVEAKRQYGSCGQFIADDKGVIDTSKNASQGGTFEGYFIINYCDVFPIFISGYKLFLSLIDEGFPKRGLSS